MRLWNLSDLSDLNQVVVEEFPVTRLGRKQGWPRPGSKLESFRILVGVASVAISLSFGSAIVNYSTVRLPNWTAAVTRTAPNFKPPLDSMFAGRFNSEWTEASEKFLVSQIAENRLLGNTANPAADIAPFVCSNQQESISVESPRLSLNAIQRIVRKQKSS